MQRRRQAIQLTKSSTVVHEHYKRRQGQLRYFILHRCQHAYYKRRRRHSTSPYCWRWLQQFRFHSIVYQMVTITKADLYSSCPNSTNGHTVWTNATIKKISRKFKFYCNPDSNGDAQSTPTKLNMHFNDKHTQIHAYHKLVLMYQIMHVMFQIKLFIAQFVFDK